LLGIGYVLFQKYQEIDLAELNLKELWGSGQFVLGVIIATLLVIPNYGIEIKKWQGLLKNRAYGFLFLTKAFLSGSAISLFMPFRSGEYLGRILYFKRRQWSRVIISSVRAGLLQLIITLVVGMLCSVFVIRSLEQLLDIPIYAAFALGITGLALIVLCIRWLPVWVRMIMKRFGFSVSQKKDSKHFVKPLLLSLLRYGVFVLQYAILFWSCDVAGLSEAMMIIPVFLLVQTLVPTFFLSEIGLRIVLASYFFNHALVIVPITLIYIINILLPALLGVFFIKRWKP